MKKITISILAFSGIIFLNSCSTTKSVTSTEAETTAVSDTKKVEENGINLAYMDNSVRPQEDFFNYVNGSWMKTTEIPSDKTRWGSFDKLREDTDNSSLSIMNKLITENFESGSEGQKIQDLYGTFIDWDKRNAEGINPIKSDLAKIDAIKNMSDFQNYLIHATKAGDNPFYVWFVRADMKNSVMNAVYLGGPELGLGKDYYQKKNEANTKTLAEYKNFAAKLFTVLGYKDANQKAASVVDFENKLANLLLTNEQGRDANLRYNPKTVTELKSLVKNVNLPNYLASVGVNTDRVILGELKYYQNLDNFINAKIFRFLKTI